jgi:6-phosphofructokinase 1
MHAISNIGLFTSGGDAPGMNAAIRAVVRTALYYNIQCTGIYDGFDGLIHHRFVPLTSRDVSNILQRGGTILRSARSKEFLEKEGRQRAWQNMQEARIDALVCIGGNGSFTGLEVLAGEFPALRAIGLPGTIDNDLFGTDYTIGFDTAVNTVVEAVDKIKDTAASHNRLFFIEVMGRDSGYIALNAGIATGAEEMLLPETPTDIDALIEKLRSGKAHNKNSSIVIVAEGDDAGGAAEIAQKVKEKYSEYDTRVSILGHMQRGGIPSAFDRIQSSRMGHAAVVALRDGRRGEMIGIVNGEIAYTPLAMAIQKRKHLPQHSLEILCALSI